METELFLDNDLPNAPDEALLAQVQGNILRGYRRLCAEHVFIRFTCSLFEARRWVAQQVASGAPLAPTTAKDQETSGVRAQGSDPVLRNFLVTADGLRYFGQAVDGMCPAFARGSRHDETLRRLNDPLPSDWPDEYRSPWHAVVALASDDEPSLANDKERLLSSVQGLATTWQETGYALGPDGGRLKDIAEPRFEHFGFHDGLSQPIYLQSHWRSLQDLYAQPVQRDEPRNPCRPLSIVLARDPLSADAGAYGSYVVYRKLQQDVSGFKERVASYVAMLQRRGRFLHVLWGGKASGQSGYELFSGAEPSPEKIRQFVLARMMGRSPDGTPVLAPDAGTKLNDFDFTKDLEGRGCPFGAHVSKMNPRGRTGDLALERSRSLTRRSWPFGVQDGSNGRYKQDVGLLFFCAQASIENQFESVQRQWANAQDVDLAANPTPSIDSVVGQRPLNQELATYADDRHRKIGETIDINFDFYDLVNLRGAEYFFALSISGIQALSNA